MAARSGDGDGSLVIEPMLDLVPAAVVAPFRRQTPAHPQANVLYSDGQWRPAMIVAWCQYRGGWAALLRWPDGHQDWRRHDAKYMLPSVEHLGSWGKAALPGRPPRR